VAPRPGTTPTTGIFGLVNAYRSHGHLIADLDPLGRGEPSHPLLDPREFGLEGETMDNPGSCGGYLGLREATPRELIASLRQTLIASLRQTYCGTFGVEFMEMRDKERRDWLIERMEPIHNQPPLSKEEHRAILRQVIAAERFEMFLHKRFLGQKRFSLEGGESLIPLLDAIVLGAAELGAHNLVVAMAHRGRLNVMTHTQGMPYRALFSEFQPSLMPLDAQGSGDVKYHPRCGPTRATWSGSTRWSRAWCAANRTIAAIGSAARSSPSRSTVMPHSPARASCPRRSRSRSSRTTGRGARSTSS
jgi:2-oxoglutarate dehydrogenase E1 component